MNRTAPLALFFLLSGILNAFGQMFPLKGTVTDVEDDLALPGASVQLIHLPDSITTGTVTNDAGDFRFDVKKGNYVVQVSFLGFETATREVTVTDRAVDLGKFRLAFQSTMLKEVTVNEDVLTAIQKGDTTEFNAEAFKMRPDADADELVEKIPGVVIKEGKVKAQGEDVKRILVDGREFFGDDVMATLKNLPAEVIDKIQIYDGQSERARLSGIEDGVLNKTINIITKVEKRNGRFGRASAGAGTDDRYAAGGVLNVFKPRKRITVVGESNNINQQNFGAEDLLGAGITGGRRRAGRSPDENGTTTTHVAGINFSQTWSEKAELSASYYGNYTDNRGYENAFREYVERRAIDVEREQESYVKQNSNHRINARFQYNIDSANTLFIQPRLNFQTNVNRSDFRSQSFLEEAPVNTSDNNTSADLSGYSLSNEIIFRHRFPKKGRTATLSLHTSASKNAGDNYLEGLTTIFRGDDIRYRRLDQYRDNNTNGYQLEASLTYTEPLRNAGNLSFSYSVGSSRNNSDRRTYHPSEEEVYDNLSERLSNTFLNDGSSHQAGAGYHYFTDKIRFSARASFQYSDLENDRTFPTERYTYREFVKFVPNASFLYRISSEKNMRLTYSSTTSNPSISQLQDFVDNNNALRLLTGNPDLQQEYRHNFNVRYSAVDLDRSSTFLVNVSGSFVQNSIANSRIINALADTIEVYHVKLGPSIQLTRPVNLDGQYSVRTFLNFGFPVKPIKSNLNFDLSGDYGREPGMSNDTLNFTYTQDYDFGVTLSSNISERIDFTISSRSGYNVMQNTFQGELNNTYFTQINRVRLNWFFLNDFYLNTSFSQRIVSGLTEGFDQNRKLWNVTLGAKIFPDRSGDIRLSVFDALKENASVDRSITNVYILDTESAVLQRYYMLRFTYTLRKFGRRQGSGRGMGSGSKREMRRDIDPDRRIERQGRNRRGF